VAIAVGAIMAELATALFAWLLIIFLPRKPAIRDISATCPETDAPQADVAALSGWACVVLGGIALAAIVLAARQDERVRAWRVAAGFLALVLPYAAFLPFAWVGFCDFG